MKKIFTLLLISVFALTSCGDDGAIGPQGPQGPAGADGLIGTVVDLQGSFTSANDYSLVLDFNDEGIEVFESDVVLVYLKTGEDGEAGGLPVEVFRMLPQTYFIDGQILQYNFDFTFFDVLIFLDGTADFAALDPSFTDNQVLRIVVVPAEFAETSGVDMSNMKAVMQALDIQPEDIKKGEIQ
ncbi:MAG: collagen-like protein [Flavobacteriaceae bacterium]|nr:collagen-like protein [Flavobacteriaceae bacterium]